MDGVQEERRRNKVSDPGFKYFLGPTLMAGSNQFSLLHIHSLFATMSWLVLLDWLIPLGSGSGRLSITGDLGLC